MCFKAGRLAQFEENWRKLTSDENVLDIAFHCYVELTQEPPKQTKLPRQNFSAVEMEIIDKEIVNLLDMEVIEHVEFEDNQFISPIFVTPKKDGEYRMILNLKELNEYIEYHHFKMDTFETALKLVKPHCFMASIDLRHAYYSVPIYKPHRRFLRFMWRGKIYEYTCLPNGIAFAPRKFTKLLKPAYAKLRQMGFTNSGYIDDSFLLGDTNIECVNNVMATQGVMSDLGFITHEKKSVVVPTQNLVFLGNHIDSIKMIVYLTQDRKHSILVECKKLRNKNVASIRVVARVSGLMVASFSAVEYGPLFYREIEKEKALALKENKGNFDAQMTMTSAMYLELDWWIENVQVAIRKITHGSPNKVITTDASNTGWGSRCDGVKIGGRWLSEEMNFHINYLELLAIFYALKSFCKMDSDIHVQILSDNTCAVSYVKNFGGIKSETCNKLAKEIWLWAIERQIWVSATHIPGVENEADFESRNHNDNTEWMLDKGTFQQIIKIWDSPELDMFASRLNKQMNRFVSWKPDPEAEFVNAFAMTWSDRYFYAFPPFSIIPRLMVKLREEQSECLLVCPIWLTQTWFVTVMEHLIEDPYILVVHDKLLTLPGTGRIHPLSNNLVLMVCRLSGKFSKVKTYQNGLQKSSWAHGDMEPRNSTQCILRNGLTTVVKGRLIVFRQMSVKY